MAIAFASQGDMEDKKISFTKVGDGLYDLTAERDVAMWEAVQG